VIQQLKTRFNLTVLLVEQNALSALKIADRGLILNLGALVASGTPAELIADPQLQAAYLGF
jgi:branched-chain amino acid transport system ATP-binding protein